MAMEEIANNYSPHDDNQKRFGLPTRTIAKVFLYRAIFADCFGKRGNAGAAYAYANDADFAVASTSVSFWEQVLDRFFEKYSGVYQNSISLIKSATTDGRILSPSGRVYQYSPVRKFNGDMDWPRTQILNHIVQGLGADFVMEARLIFWHRLKQKGYLKTGKVFVNNTVHDSIETDVANEPELCYNIAMELRKAFQDIPRAFQKHYGTEINVPMDGEVKLGWTMFDKDMKVFNPETFEKDFKDLCNS